MQAHPVASPDDAAELEEALKGDVAKIAHEGVRSHYRAELMARFNDLYGYKARMRARNGGGRNDGKGGFSGYPQVGAFPSTRARKNAGHTRNISEVLRLLQALLDRPSIIDAASEQLAQLEIADSALSELRDALVSAAEFDENIDKLSLERHLAELGVDMTAAWVRDELAEAAAPAILRNCASDAEALSAWTTTAQDFHRRFFGRDERRELQEAALAGADAGERASLRRFTAAAPQAAVQTSSRQRDPDEAERPSGDEHGRMEDLLKKFAAVVEAKSHKRKQ